MNEGACITGEFGLCVRQCISVNYISVSTKLYRYKGMDDTIG